VIPAEFLPALPRLPAGSPASEALPEETGSKRLGGAYEPWRQSSTLPYGEGLETDRASSIARQSFTRQNRIKEQFTLFASRVSAETLRANQLRLYFSAMAYVLLHGLRRLGLQGTELARAQVTTIRLRVLTIGAQIRITVRKIWISLARVSRTRRSLHKLVTSSAVDHCSPAHPIRTTLLLSHP